MSRDFYQILGVPKTALQDEIKKAYRKLAHQYHPDKQSGNEAKFKELNEAYQVLSDPQKRNQYDQFGSSPFGGFSGGGSGQTSGWDFGDLFRDFSAQGGSAFGGNMEDIFDIFGGGFGERTSRHSAENFRRGHDLQIDLTVSFYDSARGATREVEIMREVICGDCRGSGALNGRSEELMNCPDCGGGGQVRRNVRSFFGTISQISTCKNCDGTGKIPKNKCKTCGGDGRKRVRKTLEIKIPAGISNGQILIVRGAGQAGFRGGESGDLYIKAKVETDKRFERVGNDLIYELPLKLTDAILGAKISVPTLDGEREVEIPNGAQDGDQIKLKGHGIYGSGRGDQIIKIKIQIPKKIKGRAKELVEELARMGTT
jgi:molecular chaperone DnaJ